MKKVKVLLMSSALLLTLSFGATVANAASVNVGGGNWNYGVGSSYVWSYYYHGSKGHSSTAVGRYKSYSGAVGAGGTAYASAEKAWSGNKSYYNYW